MVDLSIQIEGVTGLTWQRWKRLVSEVERLGFAGLYCCDHFSFRYSVGLPSLEMTLALTYAADHTQRLRFGSLVAPLSIRDPVMLARQAMALDDLSSGRMVLGVGAGWVEDEHVRYGYDFGDTKFRMDRLAEVPAVVGRRGSSRPHATDPSACEWRQLQTTEQSGLYHAVKADEVR